MQAQTCSHINWRVGGTTHWKRSWWWEGLGAGGVGDDRGWDGWMASSTRWTWVWVNSGSWWWTERPGVLRFMGSQRVRHHWVTGLNLTEEEQKDKLNHPRAFQGILLSDLLTSIVSGGSDGKELASNAGDQVSALGREDCLEKETATHSSILCLENPMDRGAWRPAVHGVWKSQTLLSD